MYTLNDIDIMKEWIPYPYRQNFDEDMEYYYNYILNN